MTCIVGMVENGKVYMGGDSAGIAGVEIRTRKDPKVFIKNGFLIGFTGSFRMGQLLQSKFSPTRIPDGTDEYKYMLEYFIDDVRKCFKEGGYTKIESNNEKGGVFLVGFNGRLFQIEADFQVGELIEPNYNACGCGEEYAMGALYSMKQDSPEIMITKALETAEYFSCGVKGPFTILSI